MSDNTAYDSLRNNLKRFLRFQPVESRVSFQILEEHHEVSYSRFLIQYVGDENDLIPAYLLIPHGTGPFPATLVLHQHSSQWHLGKSEVCGLAGSPWQAFGPALAQEGFVVLAPDSICFEERRNNQQGLEPAPDHEEDWLQHYNEMAYRLLRGDLLMRKVLADTATGFSLLHQHQKVDPQRIGVLGHSYGGNIALFYAALEQRVRFACSSGGACSFRKKMAEGTGIEMAEVIPGFLEQYDIEDLVKCTAPRPLLIVSAKQDMFSRDAGSIVAQASEAYAKYEARERLEHIEYEGGHALTEDRFVSIVQWVASQGRAA